MTILGAIKEVLSRYESLTHIEIYQKIVEENLYQFGAQNPVAVVNGYLRRYCDGLDFPSAYPVKYFKIVGKKGTKNLYALMKGNFNETESLPVNVSMEEEDILPEERISMTYADYQADLKRQLIEHILNCHPGFFERLVLELLLAMGYGSNELSGKVVGRAHDGGIDGIIDEDKLGLSKIYIQAKRLDRGNNVGRPMIQAFVGAMQNVQKGVFFTTSSYTKAATEYAEKQQQKNLKLIDGNMLTDLMFKYGIGLEIIRTYTVYKINEDFFE